MERQPPAVKERRNLFQVGETPEPLNNFLTSPNIQRRKLTPELISQAPETTPRKSTNNLFLVQSNNFDSHSSPNNETPTNSNIVLTGIFTYENTTVDVELTDNNVIQWKLARKKQFSNMFNLDKFYTCVSHVNSLNNKKILNFQESHIDGFVLNMFEKVKPNVYKNRSFVFEHPHHDTSKLWIMELSKRIPALNGRKKVLVLLNPYSGEKKTRSIFNFQISQYLISSYIEWDLIEFHDNQPLRDEIKKMKISFDNYYGILILAGDGSISRFINIYLEMISQKEKLVDVNDLHEFINTPLCFIPVGSTNMIANTLHGTNDYLTPLMHLIQGNTTRIDLSSIFTNTDKIHSFGFGFSCGLGTTLARYLKRYSKLGTNKAQTALTRAIAKNRHRPIEIEIKYIKNKTHQPCDENLCIQNCKICVNSVKNLNARKTIDRVEQFDSIANSIEEIQHNLSSTNKYHKSDNEEWEVVRGNFIHVAFLTNSSQWNMSPGGGLSKYAHLGDGCIDLILVDQISRKDLYRFVKRHANSKNQLSLPFVKTIRIKEAKIKILNSTQSISPTLDNHDDVYFVRSNDRRNDTNSSEEENNDENSNNNKKDLSRIASINSNKNKNIFFIKNKNDLAKSVDSGRATTNSMRKSSSFVSLFKSKKKMNNFNDDDDNESEDKFTKTNRHLNDEEAKNPSVWNCDWNLSLIPEMHIKCFRQFLPVFGCGLDRDTEFEVSGTCLPGF
ncbi:unnamed protein product [Brachionus calyciflorus]|uniref:DAGKc domain-containing protein n=1 Tax=Brachionus calyciflorus TaxID=104777 RepID=A0A813P2G9_9BILA|nr:unnamed protein product [Brachionus calyciflorus]